MSGWITSLLIPIGVAAIPTLIGFLLPRKKTRGWGVSAGRFCSRFLGQKLGEKNGEKIENRLQTTLADFTDGFMEGLDEDDKR